MKVLLCNDDGVDAPGLWALYKSISQVADTMVVAPATERSAVGHGISVYSNVTLRRHVREEHSWGFGLDGTPADCVKMALSVIMRDSPPDLVISGINRGQNTGTSILYSGTVAAALEATMAGIPSIAISQAVWFPPRDDHENGQAAPTHTSDMVTALARAESDYTAAANFAVRLALQVHEKGLPGGVLLNVNVPMLPESQIRGVAISKMGRSIFVDQFRVVSECEGETCYRNVGDRLIQSPDGDDWDDLVLQQGKISLTPLHYDMTSHDFLQQLRAWALEEQEDAQEASEQVADTIGVGLRAEVHEG
jgi:5'-nucleotidase